MNVFPALTPNTSSTPWMCNSLILSLRFFKMQPFTRLATETKRGALQHTFGCRTFPLSFSITNGGYLSLSMKHNFSLSFHVGTAHFHVWTWHALSTASTSSENKHFLSSKTQCFKEVTTLITCFVLFCLFTLFYLNVHLDIQTAGSSFYSYIANWNLL